MWGEAPGAAGTGDGPRVGRDRVESLLPSPRSDVHFGPGTLLLCIPDLKAPLRGLSEAKLFSFPSELISLLFSPPFPSSLLSSLLVSSLMKFTLETALKDLCALPTTPRLLSPPAQSPVAGPRCFKTPQCPSSSVWFLMQAVSSAWDALSSESSE